MRHEPSTPRRTYPCPRCTRLLPLCGVIEAGRWRVPVFRCPECVMSIDVEGEAVEVSLSFAVDERGRVLCGDGGRLSPAPDGPID